MSDILHCCRRYGSNVSDIWSVMPDFVYRFYCSRVALDELRLLRCLFELFFYSRKFIRISERLLAHGYSGDD